MSDTPSCNCLGCQVHAQLERARLEIRRLQGDLSRAWDEGYRIALTEAVNDIGYSRNPYRDDPPAAPEQASERHEYNPGNGGTCMHRLDVGAVTEHRCWSLPYDSIHYQPHVFVARRDENPDRCITCGKGHFDLAHLTPRHTDSGIDDD